jgi:hypothetical protein
MKFMAVPAGINCLITYTCLYGDIECLLLRPIHTQHAVPLPCCAAKGLEFVFPVLFVQCGRV